MKKQRRKQPWTGDGMSRRDGRGFKALFGGSYPGARERYPAPDFSEIELTGVEPDTAPTKIKKGSRRPKLPS